jgi:uncharacterized protein DUF29
MVVRSRAKKRVREEAPAVRIDDDFHGWLLDQASALRQQRAQALDWSNLAEELEAMARKDRTELRSHLRNLLSHLLKWAYQPGRRTNSWKATIDASRDRIEDLLEESPSLRAELNKLFSESKAYARAVRDAATDTGGQVHFPSQSPWTLDKALEPDFLPE